MTVSGSPATGRRALPFLDLPATARLPLTALSRDSVPAEAGMVSPSRSVSRWSMGNILAVFPGARKAPRDQALYAKTRGWVGDHFELFVDFIGGCDSKI